MRSDSRFASRILLRLALLGVVLLAAGLLAQPADAGGCVCGRDPGREPGEPPPAPPPPPPPPDGDRPPTRSPPSDPPPEGDPAADPPPADEPTTTPDDDPPPAEETTPSEEAPAPEPVPEAPPPLTPSTPVGPAPSPTLPAAGAHPGGRRARTGKTSSDVMSTWRGWWAVNDRALLPDRARDAGITTPSANDDAVRHGGRMRRELAVRSEILPALRRLLAPEERTPNLLRRTSLLALGKIAQTEEDTALLVLWLADSRADLHVREAAALGLGLLRRTDASRRFQAHVLDALRARLVRVIGDTSTPDSVRATCALSLGLLGDQPFGEGIHTDGRLVTRWIWRSLEAAGRSDDVPVALLTALGMQPATGVPGAIREALAEAVYGKSVQDRRWSDMQRGHALTALARLDPASASSVAQRVLEPRRTPRQVRRAALLAIGHDAAAMSTAERLDMAGHVHQALGRFKDPLSVGLCYITMGRLVRAHLESGDPLVRDMQTIWRRLLAEARSGSAATRGFAVLGVGLAVRPPVTRASPSRWHLRARREAEELLLHGFESARLDPDIRCAHAVALGILCSRLSVPALVAQVQDRHAVDPLRADASVALGQIGHDSPEVIRALNVALAERRKPKVQAGAALGLSLLRGPGAGSRLLRELERAHTHTDVIRLTEPLGYLGDPALARPLVEIASSPKHADFPRALVIVALGNIGDPEPRPSLAGLGRDANYPEAPPALRDTLFTR